MEYLYYAIIPFIVTLLLPIVYVQTQKKAKDKSDKLNKKNFIMRASKSFSILLMMMTFFLLISIILLNIFDNLEIAANIFLDLIVILMAIGCIQSLRQKIVVKGNIIIYTPIIGKTKKYSFNDIKKLKIVHYSRGLTLYNIYTDKKIFKFSNQAIGYILLLDLLKENNIDVVE